MEFRDRNHFKDYLVEDLNIHPDDRTVGVLYRFVSEGANPEQLRLAYLAGVLDCYKVYQPETEEIRRQWEKIK